MQLIIQQTNYFDEQALKLSALIAEIFVGSPKSGQFKSSKKANFKMGA